MSEKPYAPVDLVCPNCGRHNNAASYVGEQNIRPHVGDIGVCYGCIEPFFYTEEGGRILTFEEEREVRGDPQTIMAQVAIRVSKKMKGM